MDAEVHVEVECCLCHGIRTGNCQNALVSRSKTTSIKRPVLPSAKEGSSRLGDITRSIPVDKRLSRRPKVALFAGIAALAVIGTMAAAVFVLPMGTWLDQGEDLDQRQPHSMHCSVNGQLAAEVDRLRTDDGVREAAREEIGFVADRRPAIARYSCRRHRLPADLPGGWPYNVVTRDLRRAHGWARTRRHRLGSGQEDFRIGGPRSTTGVSRGWWQHSW